MDARKVKGLSSAEVVTEERRSFLLASGPSSLNSAVCEVGRLGHFASV
jgi:hypothetical protein